MSGLFFEFEAIRTESSDRDAPRRYRNGPRWTSRFRHVCGIAHTNYEAYAIADNFDKDGAPEEYFNVKAERSVLRRPFHVATAPTRLASTRRGRGRSLFDFRGHESVRAGSSRRR